MPYTPTDYAVVDGTYAAPPAVGTPVATATAAKLNKGETQLAAVTVLAEAAVPNLKTQSAESTFAPIFDIDPASSSAPKFNFYMNSAANTGSGAGTYNRGVWMGWNAGRYLGGTFETGKQGVYMGMEDNYYDAGGDETYGVEWYVGYTTPDGSTLGPADLRPFYFRVKASNTNTTTKEVIAWVDVGAGTGGNFSVMGSVGTGTELFIVHKSLGIYSRLPSYFTANNAAAGGAGTIQVKPTDGYAQVDIVSPGVGVGGAYSVLAFKHNLTYRWTISATTGEFYVSDNTNSSRRHIDLVPGASSTAASTTFNSNVIVAGRLNAAATVTTQTSSYTLALTDANTIIEMNSASAQVFTIPPNASVAFPIGTTIELVRLGAGSVTITPGSGVTIPNSIETAGTSSRTITSRHTSASLYKRGTNEWVLSGSIT